MASAEIIAKAVAETKAGGGRTAGCPARDDRTPNHSIYETDDGETLVRSHAGCDQPLIAALQKQALRNENQSLANILVELAPLPRPRRSASRAAWRRARWFRGPTLSCAEWAMALVGRPVALAPDDQTRLEALRHDARVLAALVRESEILKPDAVDRILNAGIAFGIAKSAIDEILNAEFVR
jgi:hypothetical protein